MVDNRKENSTENFRVFINAWSKKFTTQQMTAKDFKELNINVKKFVSITA